MRIASTIVLCSLALLSAEITRAATVSFQGLGGAPEGPFPDTLSNGVAISGDGKTIVGGGFGNQAALWTLGPGGWAGQKIGQLPSSNQQAVARGISHDGSLVVGDSRSSAVGGGLEAFRWTTSTGIAGLGDNSSAEDTSADGSVIIGSWYLPPLANGVAFRWTAASGKTPLGKLPGDAYSLGAAISDNGTIVVGTSGTDFYIQEQAFRWTESSGMVALGDLPGGSSHSKAHGVSADGTAIVGAANIAYSGTTLVTSEGFRWTSAGGMVGLGDLPGGVFSSWAFDTSADGSTIVGFASSSAGQEGAFWRQGQGWTSLTPYLLNHGAMSAAGWSIKNITGVSDDGQTLVGIGTNPQGKLEGWVATVPVPEPSGIVLLILGAVLLIGLAFRRNSYGALLVDIPTAFQTGLSSGVVHATAVVGVSRSLRRITATSERLEILWRLLCGGKGLTIPLFFVLLTLSQKHLRADYATLTTVGADRLRDKVTYVINADNTQGKMQISLFTPINYYQFAFQLGFDHFNFVSEIIGAPSHWEWSKVTQDNVQILLPDPSLANPLLDPAADGSQYFIRSLLGPDPAMGVQTEPGREFDLAPPYYNEDGGFPASEWLQFVRPIGLASSFNFFDTPSLAREVVSGLNEHLSFRTRLVGVKADGSLHYWEGINTNVYWSTNSVAVDGAMRLSTLSNVPIESGGILNASFTVPEPSTLVMSALGGLALAACAWRQRKKRLATSVVNPTGSRWTLAITLAVLTTTIAAPAVSSAAVVSFQGLGSGSYAFAVSGDGTAIAGVTPGNTIARWTLGPSGWSMQDLGQLPANVTQAFGRGISNNGQVLVGDSRSALASGGLEAVRWNPANGLSGFGGSSTAEDTSADGSVVVGSAFSGAFPFGSAFRWTAATGMVQLGALPGDNGSNASAVSDDGSIVVGQSGVYEIGNGVWLSLSSQAYRWSAGTGMVGLGDLPGGPSASWAAGISADGSVVVGLADITRDSKGIAIGSEAFRWTSADGMSGLGDLPGGPVRSASLDASGDGTVVVGYGTTAAGQEATLWRNGSDALSLKDHLLANGINQVDGWSLVAANGVANDGLTIVGVGTNPSGQSEAWIATITVPEPSTIAMTTIGALALTAVAWRKRPLLR